MLTDAEIETLAAEQAEFVLKDNYNDEGVRALLQHAFVRGYYAYHRLHERHATVGSYELAGNRIVRS